MNTVCFHPASLGLVLVAALPGPMVHGQEAACYASGQSGEYMGSPLSGDLLSPSYVGAGITGTGAGALHFFRIDAEGRLFASGNNFYGQLADGTYNYVLRSTIQVEPAREFKQVAAGAAHSLFLLVDGTLWAAGGNWNGQLGDGTVESRRTMVFVADQVSSIAAGSYHSAYIRQDGTLWTFGLNSDGQLGRGNLVSSDLPVPVADDVASVACGNRHTLFITGNGYLWGMGKNSSGQIDGTSPGDKTRPTLITNNALAADGGKDFSVVVTKDLGLYAFGSNTSGQLGTGDRTDRAAPTLVANDVIAAAAGDEHTVFLKRDRSLWAMGDGSKGQLGRGTTDSSTVPVRILAGVARIDAGTFSTWLIDTVEKPGWGLLTLARRWDGQRYYESDAYGYFAIPGADDSAAIGFSLMGTLTCDGTTVRSDTYGRLTPTGYPGWVDSEYFDRVHFSPNVLTYDQWVHSERFNWMKFVTEAHETGGGRIDFYLWVHRLQTWIAVQEGGNFFSFDMGALTPVAGSPTRYNTPIGPVTVDGDNPLGWLRSDRFGYVWWARDGNRTWFWSEARAEWLGLTFGGGIWSTAEERFL